MTRISALTGTTLAAALALGMAAPASAQRSDGWRDNDRAGSDYRQDDRRDWREGDRRDDGREWRSDRRDDRLAFALRAEINELGRDIYQAERRGLIRYAPELRVQFGLLEDRYDHMAHRGYSDREVRWLQQKSASLRRSLEIHLAQAERRGRFAFRDTDRTDRRNGQWRR